MLFYAALLLSLWAPSADDLFLGGVVFDLNAAAVQDVHVRLEHLTDREHWETTTTRDGTFRFDRLAFGTYRLTVQKEGFFETATEIRLEASKTVEFTLAPAETLKQEIDVIARPEPINPDSVSTQTSVNDEVIQNIPYTGRRNFVNALALMPGVLRDNSERTHIHGSRADQIQYQFDGLNLTDPSTGALASNVPLDAIESVDIDLAGYSAEFGKASGGIVRVHSQFVGNQYRFNITDFIPGIDFRQKSVAEFSPRLSFSGPLVQEKLWFLYSSSFRYLHNYVEDLPKPDNQYNQTTADQFVKLQWNLKESHVLTLDLLHNAEYLSNAGLSITRPRDATTNTLRRGATLGISDRQAVHGLLLESIFQWTRRRDSNLAKGTSPLEIRPGLWQGNFFSDQRGRSQRYHIAQTVAWETKTGGLAHRLKAGAEFDHVISNLWLDRRPYREFSTAGDLKSSVSFAGPSSAGIRNREYGLFLLDRIILNPKLQIEMGMRFDREQVVGRNNVGPRAAFSFLPLGTDRSKVSGGVGLFYDNISLVNLQLPRMQRRYTITYEADVSTPAAAPTDVHVSRDLQNPSGVHWNLAWEHEWAPRWVSRIDYIQKKGRDQVRLAALPNANGFDMVFNNSGTSHYKAIELTIDRPIRTNLRILGSYTYSEAKDRPSLSLDFPDPAVESLSEEPLDWNPRHRFISWGYFPIFAHMNASYSLEAHSGLRYSTIDSLNRIVGGYNARAMPIFFVTNVSVEKELPIPFNKRVAVRLGVTNLFNRFNPRFVDANVNSPYFGAFTDSSARHFVGRVRILKR
jgi:outer membrane receptor protein involved in Fe transport